MSKIFIVRHGQDTYNVNHLLNGRKDTELTDLGRQQAKATGERLKSAGIKIIYSSPLKRARDTASIIARELGLPEPIVMPELIERDFGDFTGRTTDEIAFLDPNYIATDRVNYFVSGGGAEDFSLVYERAQKALAKIAVEHPTENVLLVTHDIIGKTIRAAFNGWTWQEGLKTPYFGNADTIILENK